MLAARHALSACGGMLVAAETAAGRDNFKTTVNDVHQDHSGDDTGRRGHFTMNTSLSMKAILHAFALLAAIGFEQRALADEDTYRVTELRDITNQAHVGTVRAEHLNNMSEIIGSSTDASGTLRPTFWHHFRATDLHAAYNQQIDAVNGLNDRSEVVGSGPGGLVFLRHGKAETLMNSGAALNGSLPVLNNRGEIAYFLQVSDMLFDSFYWFNGSLSTVSGTDDFNFVNAINTAGVMCGSSGHDTRAGSGNPPAWVSTGNNGTQLAVIPPLPGDTAVGAIDINDSNQVVGASSIATSDDSFRFRAYLWQDGVASDLLMTLAGDQNSVPTAINNSTVIVGWSGAASAALNASRAVIWHNGTTRELTAQIAATDPLKRYVKLYTAKDINDAG